MKQSEEKFIIIYRYEHLSKDGKRFTDWVNFEVEPMDKEEALNKIKELKTEVKDIDKKTKLKHEYDIKPYSQYVSEVEELYKTINELNKKNKAYFKSAEYKELQRKKRQSAKELKERQKKYIEEHKNDTK